ncbi:MAG: cysteine--tRNA ligase [Planctomycetes bacterium]|nr:cysteine--tRNA ligase [Planctomycetota bacterium]
MTLRLYDTAHSELRPFEPREPGVVRMYNCGPTVYSSPHIGNFRSFLTADLLRRHLEARGMNVVQVMNITDVGHLTEDDLDDSGEDRMLIAARREKLDPYAIARKYESEFLAAVDALHMRRAQEYPRATDHIPEMIEIIQGLVANGHAYVVGGNVYYSIASFPRFGKLSGKVIEELEEGARIAVNPEKRDPRDFALWKTDDKHLMQWDSPWGRGFPGWHIECSAMSRKYLGDQFDVHTGGEDNLFPHHECEVAQSEAFTEKVPFVGTWLHTRHLLVDEKKMAKSLGNFLTIEQLLGEGWTGHEIRLALLRVHYRMPMNFSRTGLGESRAFLTRIQECRARLLRIAHGQEAAGTDDATIVLRDAESAFGEALDDDLNIAKALAVLSGLVSDVNAMQPSVESAQNALALFRRLEDWCGCVGDEPDVAAEVGGVLWGGKPDDPRRQSLLDKTAEREAARKSKDFQAADRLRDEITAEGFKIVDTPRGPRLEPL